MSTKIQIRRYQDTDQEAVIDVVDRVLHEYEYAFDPALDADLCRISSRYTPQKKSVFLLAVDGERVIGTCALRRKARDICEFKRLYLLKEYRGKGIGKMLFNKARLYAKKFDYHIMKFDTVDSMKQAQALYERAGCRVTARRKEKIWYECAIR